MAGLGFFYGFLVSLTCANLVFTAELVSPKEVERWGRGYVRNKQSSEGLCQGLARLVLLSPTCSKMRGRKVQHALWNSVGFDCNSQKKTDPTQNITGILWILCWNDLTFMQIFAAGKKNKTDCFVAVLTGHVVQMSKHNLLWMSEKIARCVSKGNIHAVTQLFSELISCSDLHWSSPIKEIKVPL